MNKIKDKLLKLKQEINSIVCSIPLDYVNLDFVEKMELESQENNVFKDTLKKINLLLKKALNNLGDNDSLIKIKNIYSEAYIYSKLKSVLAIQKLPEEKNKKTPDYSVKYRGKEIFIELKSPNMLGGTLKHRTIMYDALDSKIDTEMQIQNGSKVAFSEHLIKPYRKENGDEYDYSSVRLVIESLIGKIDQNIKNGQYSLGDTVLLVDLSDQLPLISTPQLSIQELYDYEPCKTMVSGDLWHVAFGKIGKKIFKPPEFCGATNLDGELRKEGILISYPDIKGLIFHVNDDFLSLGKLSEPNLNVIRLLDYLSKQGNKCLETENNLF
jgi:hypothetical protein